ncbi:MAG: DUF5615 family PIN-like protein [Bacteroidota bacterium]
MSRLFISFYLDEDVDVLVATMLQHYGFTAVTVRDVESYGLDDAAQLDYAVKHDLVLVTHNRVDFERLAQAYFEQEKDHAGLILAVRRAPREIVRRLLTIADHVTADEMQTPIRYI